MSDSVRDLLVRGIAAAKAGERQEAFRYLEWALNLDATSEQRIQAWYWLSECSEDAEEKRYYLQQVLCVDPNCQPARRGLAVLEGRLKPEEIVDANRLPGVHLQAGADARRFVCPTCGGRLTYTPDGKSLTSDASLAARFAARERIIRPKWGQSRISSLDLQIFGFKLALLPFWRACYQHAGGANEVLISGQSRQIWD
jgi:tetratricopeptide (TPR) repeat protein